MKRYEWSSWTDSSTVYKRAGGRRRYNAMQRRRACERRAAIAQSLAENPMAALFSRGLPVALAPTFGVHPTTIWRDLQLILWGGRTVNYYDGDEFLFSVTREYPGGRVLGVEDVDGNQIRGAVRRNILRRIPRYFG